MVPLSPDSESYEPLVSSPSFGLIMQAFTVPWREPTAGTCPLSVTHSKLCPPGYGACCWKEGQGPAALGSSWILFPFHLGKISPSLGPQRYFFSSASFYWMPNIFFKIIKLFTKARRTDCLPVILLSTLKHKPPCGKRASDPSFLLSRGRLDSHREQIARSVSLRNPATLDQVICWQQ